MIGLNDPYQSESPSPLFAPGDLVFHKRYHYRGVVVSVDRICQADNTWYYSNQTQPDRSQPWYLLLVHRKPHTTYVAQSNLEPDPTGAPIEHPLIGHFFSGFKNGSYIRNNKSWPDIQGS